MSAPPSPRDLSNGDNAPTTSTPEQLTSHIQWLRNEVARLKNQLTSSLQERKDFKNVLAVTNSLALTFFYCDNAEEEKVAHYAQEEKHIREENLRLQRRLQMEMERREALCRHLSESESRFVIDQHQTFSKLINISTK